MSGHDEADVFSPEAKLLEEYLCAENKAEMLAKHITRRSRRFMHENGDAVDGYKVKAIAETANRAIHETLSGENHAAGAANNLALSAFLSNLPYFYMYGEREFKTEVGESLQRQHAENSRIVSPAEKEVKQAAYRTLNALYRNFYVAMLERSGEARPFTDRPRHSHRHVDDHPPQRGLR
jgi:hypothetical protein